MKRILTILMVTTMVFVFAACQVTPEKPIVVKKDTERMVDKAKEDLTGNEGKNLREQYNIPDTYQFESQGDHKLKVISNAEIIVPDSDKMPIINVKSGVFSQELVDKLWNVLIGDTQMWELSEQPTKSDIQEMIVRYKQLIVDAQENGTDDGLKALNDGLSELEKMYTAAPETTDAVISDGQLKELVTWDPVSGKIDTRYTGVRTCSLKSKGETNSPNAVYKWFNVNNPWQGKEGSIKSDVMPARILYETQAIGNNYMRPGTPITEDEELNETVKNFLKLTPKEAKTKVDKFLKSCEIPMKVSSIQIISDGWNIEGKQESPKHYAYSIECVRTVDGLTVGGQGSTMESKASYNKPWYYEYMTIALGDNGIIDLSWSAPLEILDTEVENSQLLPFNEIKTIFEKMIFIQYEPSIDKSQTRKYNISHVNLELMRIIKQNTDLEGLLIPVWNFYSNRENFDAEGKLIGEGKQFEGIILSINAVDGSIIDVAKGY